MTLEDATPAPSLADGAADHDALFALAERRLPGACLGNHSLPDDVRIVIRGGKGSRVEDARGRWYVDYVGGAGALVLGHAFPSVVAAVRNQAERGLHFYGAPNERCLELAEVLVRLVPCAEKVAFTTTGSEATSYALRVARAATGRSKILKFEGAYHGNHDYAGFSVAPDAPSNYPRGRPDTGGMPANMTDNVLVAPFNDMDATERIVREHRGDLAAVIVEPVQRIVFPNDEFLPGLRRICDENGVLLVFDEVVTGFRLAVGGAQEHFGVLPDLAAYGKVAGGGAALGCVAGRAEHIDLMSPRNRGSADYAHVNGTLHGNPVAAAAALATLAEVTRPGFHAALHALSDDLQRACQQVLDRRGAPARAVGRASFWQILFLDGEPSSHADILRSDMAASRALDLALLREGLFVLPNTRRFVSAVHDGRDVEDTARALDAACRRT